ncbi:hypothetical protein DPEC_G00113080 [Dallia pectoralis]|uniref:Uncharacterized protein n=1 Tax=Dallia pectoralis TaxID=75939 RepID=A0ACC2GTZ8_DALPE|nr:hypothetical protein DPEC_G00113080 [Dallia pectoralis]
MRVICTLCTDISCYVVSLPQLTRYVVPVLMILKMVIQRILTPSVGGVGYEVAEAETEGGVGGGCAKLQPGTAGRCQMRTQLTGSARGHWKRQTTVGSAPFITYALFTDNGNYLSPIGSEA